jgi:hypothetical protein
MSASSEILDLEHVWEKLANAIDTAGPGKEVLFLSKFAILASKELNDRQQAERLVEIASVLRPRISTTSLILICGLTPLAGPAISGRMRARRR